jgi:hypothetical protein
MTMPYHCIGVLQEKNVYECNMVYELGGVTNDKYISVRI